MQTWVDAVLGIETPHITYAVLSLVYIGAIFERKWWVIRSEIGRLLFLVILAGAFTTRTSWFVLAMAVAASLAATSIYWLYAYRSEFVSADGMTAAGVAGRGPWLT